MQKMLSTKQVMMIGDIFTAVGVWEEIHLYKYNYVNQNQQSVFIQYYTIQYKPSLCKVKQVNIQQTPANK